MTPSPSSPAPLQRAAPLHPWFLNSFRIGLCVAGTAYRMRLWPGWFQQPSVWYDDGRVWMQISCDGSNLWSLWRQLRQPLSGRMHWYRLRFIAAQLVLGVLLNFKMIISAPSTNCSSKLRWLLCWWQKWDKSCTWNGVSCTKCLRGKGPLCPIIARVLKNLPDLLPFLCSVVLDSIIYISVFFKFGENSSVPPFYISCRTFYHWTCLKIDNDCSWIRILQRFKRSVITRTYVYIQLRYWSHLGHAQFSPFQMSELTPTGPNCSVLLHPLSWHRRVTVVCSFEIVT